MAEVLVVDWYDGALAGFARDIPVLPGPCRFECIATFSDQHADHERLFVVAPISVIDFADAQALSLGGGMMCFAPADPRSKEADALMQRTAKALVGSQARFYFAEDVADAGGLVHPVAPQANRVATALERKHIWHGNIDDWVDIRERSTSLPNSAP